MSLFDTLKGAMGLGGGASSLYQQGMKKAHNKDWAGAIKDYTAIIDQQNSPGKFRAMAFFNRALAYSYDGDHDKARADMEQVLKVSEAPINVLAAAKEKLARWTKRGQ